MKTAWRVAAAGMGLVFVTFASLQFNDPDPGVWAPAYLLPACVSLACALGMRAGRRVAALAFVYACWAAAWDPGHGPEQMAHEYAKEVAGLLIAAGWLALLSRAFATLGRKSGTGGT